MLVHVAPEYADRLNLPKSVRDALTEETRGRLRAHQVNAVLRVSRVLMLVNVVNALLVVFVLASEEQMLVVAATWFCAVVLLASLSFRGVWQRRHKERPEITSTRTIRRLIRSSGLFGLLWTVPGVLLVPGLDGFPLAFCLAVLTGMIAGGAYALYPVPAAALAFMLPVTSGVVAGLAIGQGWLALTGALVATMFVIVFFAGTRRHADLFVSEFLLRLELERRGALKDDVLEDKRLEDLAGHRRPQASSLAAARKDAVGDFAGSVAHSFNNLFATIRGNAELLELDGMRDKSLLRPIVEATDTGVSRIDTYLLVTGRRILKPQDVDVAKLVRNFGIVLFSEPSDAPGLSVSAGQPSAMVRADPAALATCLKVLIADAETACAIRGTLEIEVRADETAELSPHPSGLASITMRATGWEIDEKLAHSVRDPVATICDLRANRELAFAHVAAFARESGGALEITKSHCDVPQLTLYLPSAKSPARKGALPVTFSGAAGS